MKRINSWRDVSSGAININQLANVSGVSGGGVAMAWPYQLKMFSGICSLQWRLAKVIVAKSISLAGEMAYQ